MIVGLSSAIGTYPSGHATDEVRVSTSGAAESLRDPARTKRDRVYINLDSRKTMVEDHKKSESEDESEQKVPIAEIRKWIKDLKWEMTKRMNALHDLSERVRALEKSLIHAQHTNTEDGSRHQNDGGWFD